jgi:hypothetical protein
VVGGEQGRAEGAEDVMVGGAAGGVVGSEPVDQAEPPQDGQPVLGGVVVAEGELGELVGGEDPVLGQQPAQPVVAVGHPASDGGQSLGGAWPADAGAHQRHLQRWEGLRWQTLAERATGGPGRPAGTPAADGTSQAGRQIGTPVAEVLGRPAAALGGSFAGAGVATS